MLETGQFKRPAKRVGVRGPALRVWIDEAEVCTASAAGSDRVSLRLESVFRPWDASPVFEARAADVKRVYSEWQPAQADLEFLAATFPADLEITFSFERPKSEREWAAAIQEAARIRAEADAEQRMEAAEQFPFLAILRKRSARCSRTAMPMP